MTSGTGTTPNAKKPLKTQQVLRKKKHTHNVNVSGKFPHTVHTVRSRHTASVIAVLCVIIAFEAGGHDSAREKILTGGYHM